VVRIGERGEPGDLGFPALAELGGREGFGRGAEGEDAAEEFGPVGHGDAEVGVGTAALVGAARDFLLGVPALAGDEGGGAAVHADGGRDGVAAFEDAEARGDEAVDAVLAGRFGAWRGHAVLGEGDALDARHVEGAQVRAQEVVGDEVPAAGVVYEALGLDAPLAAPAFCVGVGEVEAALEEHGLAGDGEVLHGQLLGHGQLVADAVGHLPVIARNVRLYVRQELGRDDGDVVLVGGHALGEGVEDEELFVGEAEAVEACRVAVGPGGVVVLDGSVEAVAEVLDVADDLSIGDFEAARGLGALDGAALAQAAVDVGDALDLAHGATFCDAV